MDNEIKELNKKLKNKELAYEGMLAEYQYVNQKKDETIKKLNEEKQKVGYYKKEFEQAVEKMEKYKAENEAIKNSKWWKIREKLRGGNKNG